MEVPEHVAKVLHAVGADTPEGGGMPCAVGRLIGILGWVAVAAYNSLEPEQYRIFAGSVSRGLDMVRSLINSANPEITFQAMEAAELERPPNTFPGGSTR